MGTINGTIEKRTYVWNSYISKYLIFQNLINISTKKIQHDCKRNLTRRFLTLNLLKFHSPPISSSSSRYPLFFPYLNVASFQTFLPLPPFANFFTNSPLPPLPFFFLSPNFPSSLSPSPQLSPQLQCYAHVRTHGGSLFSDVQAF